MGDFICTNCGKRALYNDCKCTNCWEVESRLDMFVQSVAGRNFVLKVLEENKTTYTPTSHSIVNN